MSRALNLSSEYGSICHTGMVKIEGMKKTLHIDDKLLQEAKAACAAATDTDTVRQGLEALVRHAAHQRLRSFRGSEKDAADIPRRREKPAAKRKVV